jgi:peptidoglycan/xylan/chitin deacetylase (PgdA/CDA1 family)
MSEEKGVFILSLDTELAWGTFDKGNIDTHESAYHSTRSVVAKLCELFDQYEISATWAVVAHLLDDCDGSHPDLLTGTERDERLPCLAGVDRELWYAPDLVKTIQSCDTEQDIGLHGYSHLIFGEHSREVAEQELDATVETAQKYGLSPSSFVFPRNSVAHLSALAERGFSAYRGVDARWYERRSLPPDARKPLRFLDEGLGITPPAVTPWEESGLVCIPGSNPFRPLHGGWKWTPDGAQVRRAKKGLQSVADSDGIYHLWFHPFNLGRDSDQLLDILERILGYATKLRSDGQIDVLSMRDVAAEYRNGRWC